MNYASRINVVSGLKADNNVIASSVVGLHNSDVGPAIN